MSARNPSLMNSETGSPSRRELPPRVNRGTGDVRKRNEVILLIWVVPFGHGPPEGINDGQSHGAGRRENEPADAEPAGQVLGPAEEHVGNYGLRRRWVALEPMENGVLELAEDAHHRPESVRRKVLDVLHAGGEGRVGGERQDEGGDGREGDVSGGDEDGYGEAACSELVGKVQEGYHVALCRVREDQDVCAVVGCGGDGRGGHGGRLKKLMPFRAVVVKI
ncbi:hypothetical protein RJ640_004209 [Escallonia rubra]|uniref:Uncharacterized protein n=1 Tax=Escallonia rubra TaxID=112253 RepID=A0AA88U2L8_9ASTE|nr:hypothetical protein RJ640_004209 [Escallonia rubra]